MNQEEVLHPGITYNITKLNQLHFPGISNQMRGDYEGLETRGQRQVYKFSGIVGLLPGRTTNLFYRDDNNWEYTPTQSGRGGRRVRRTNKRLKKKKKRHSKKRRQ